MATTSPNMNLPVPTVSVDGGPAWAQNVDSSLSIIDEHNHSPGSGVPINPAGININADLTFNSNNAILLRSTRYVPTAIAASSPDLGCVYVNGVDLYYNDLNGNAVQITHLGSVNSGAGSINGLPSGTASATYSPTAGTFIWQQATGVAANMDAATYVLRYPGSYPAASGNAIALQAPTSLATYYALTFPAALPGSGSAFMVLDSSGNISATIGTNDLTYQNLSGSADIMGSQLSGTANIVGAQIANRTITQINLANRSTGSGTLGTGGIPRSNGSGSFTVTSSPTPITNQVVTLATDGSPVMLMVTPDNASGAGLINVQPGSTIVIYIENTTLSENVSAWQFSNATGGAISLPASLSAIDFGVAALPGTYSYATYAYLLSGPTCSVVNITLLAYEL